MEIDKRTKNYPELKAVLESSNLPDITRDNLKRILERKLKETSRDSNFPMLDVGPSDGEMSFPLVEWLGTRFANFHYVAVEPEKEAFDKLNQRIAQKGDYRFVSYNVTLKDYLETVKEEEGIFDVALFSYVFYHFPKETWATIISDSQRLLKKDGLTIIVLDSYEGRLWEMRSLITEGKIDTLEFGDLYFAQDMEEFLETMGIRYFTDKFTVHISIKGDDQKLFNMARALAFLYRTFPEKILAEHKKELIGFLEETKIGERHVIEDNMRAIAFRK